MEDKKTLTQIKEEANKSHQDFLKELAEVRKYQQNNTVVKKTYGGYVLNLGNNNYSSSKKG